MTFTWFLQRSLTSPQHLLLIKSRKGICSRRCNCSHVFLLAVFCSSITCSLGLRLPPPAPGLGVPPTHGPSSSSSTPNWSCWTPPVHWESSILNGHQNHLEGSLRQIPGPHPQYFWFSMGMGAGPEHVHYQVSRWCWHHLFKDHSENHCSTLCFLCIHWPVAYFSSYICNRAPFHFLLFCLNYPLFFFSSLCFSFFCFLRKKPMLTPSCHPAGLCLAALTANRTTMASVSGSITFTSNIIRYSCTFCQAN